MLGGPLQRIVIRLETGAGVVPVELSREGPKITFGWMDQPIPTWRPFENAGRLFDVLGVDGSGLPVESYDLGPGFTYVELGSPEAVAALEPDFRALMGVVEDGTYCFARDGVRWKSRMFAPADGVAEDPATGSAAGPLAVHLARHGRIGFGEEIEIRQGVELGRPSTLYAEVEGTRRADRAGARRRLGGPGRARRVQDSLSASERISGSSTGSAVQKTPPSRET